MENTLIPQINSKCNIFQYFFCKVGQTYPIALLYNDPTFNDILTIIFGFIDKGSDYKAITYVCTRWNNIMRKVQPDADVKLCNHLLTLLKLFPDQE
jgi:hypothetical protein